MIKFILTLVGKGDPITQSYTYNPGIHPLPPIVGEISIRNALQYFLPKEEINVKLNKVPPYWYSYDEVTLQVTRGGRGDYFKWKKPNKIVIKGRQIRFPKLMQFLFVTAKNPIEKFLKMKSLVRLSSYLRKFTNEYYYYLIWLKAVKLSSEYQIRHNQKLAPIYIKYQELQIKIGKVKTPKEKDILLEKQRQIEGQEKNYDYYLTLIKRTNDLAKYLHDKIVYIQKHFIDRVNVLLGRFSSYLCPKGRKLFFDDSFNFFIEIEDDYRTLQVRRVPIEAVFSLIIELLKYYQPSLPFLFVSLKMFTKKELEQWYPFVRDRIPYLFYF
ncbi:MAG: hypothetical protein ACFFG0_41165 [Candidatus Thorarchaeota archaeon]